MEDGKKACIAIGIILMALLPFGIFLAWLNTINPNIPTIPGIIYAFQGEVRVEPNLFIEFEDGTTKAVTVAPLQQMSTIYVGAKISKAYCYFNIKLRLISDDPNAKADISIGYDVRTQSSHKGTTKSYAGSGSFLSVTPGLEKVATTEYYYLNADDDFWNMLTVKTGDKTTATWICDTSVGFTVTKTGGTKETLRYIASGSAPATFEYKGYTYAGEVTVEAGPVRTISLLPGTRSATIHTMQVAGEKRILVVDPMWLAIEVVGLILVAIPYIPGVKEWVE